MKQETYKRYDSFFRWLLKLPLVGRYVQEKVYDRRFFEKGGELKKQSSRRVAEVIDSFYDFQTVLDIGCGSGLYIEEFHRMGKEVVGCDASPDAIEMAPGEFTVFYGDVTKPILLNRRFDLVLCFEVAEHIKKKYSGQLVKNCARYGDRIIFTAAPEGQGGVGHINEQPYEFWIGLFAKSGFRYDRALSEKVRARMKEKDVVSWIADNFMSFSKND
jgi:2-polyprenyl-3-methyl-5-hydroxy-6-metoxy-1,4-benzoquinol methylase